MKKVLVLLTLLSSLCFGSEFKSYEGFTFDKCVETLNELNKDFLVLSYKIVPLHIEKNILTIDDTKYFNMIVEVETLEY